MNNTELLKESRNLLLGLHKSLVDFERSIYEGMHGTQTGGQFLNVLLEDADFAWLRKFSTLIVDIDEMFAQKDGFADDSVEAHLTKLRELIGMTNTDEEFIAKYQGALQQDMDAAAKQGELRSLLSQPPAIAGG
ncbi:MAG: hypothetical protein H7070_09905 [Saprospiraceae bacterium]|nr:hypothetical protein [Pyrinomonadaceae bacterium]